MDVLRTPSPPSSSDILPSYTLQETTAAFAGIDQAQLVAPLSSSSSSSSSPPPNPWAREKGGATRRDLSEYRNSVVLVDEQSGEVVGVLGREGGVVLDEQPSSSPSREVEPADSFLDQRTDPIEPYASAPTSTSTPTPSILLTPSPSTSVSPHLPSGLPPAAPPPTPKRPSFSSSSFTYQDLRSSPSDISLRTLLAPHGHHSQLGLPDQLGPSGTTIRRVHSRRRTSGTVTSVGGSSFYTAREPGGGGDEGTWTGSLMGSVRGAILGASREEGEGEVLLRFFQERESVFVASQSQPQPPAPSSLALSSSTPGLDSPESTTFSLPEEPNLLPPTDSASSSSFWSYFSLPSQPLAGASLMWDASRNFLGNVWDLLDFSTAPDDSSTSPQHPAGSGHGRYYRSSFYYHPNPPPAPASSPSQLRVRAVDDGPDSLDSTIRPDVVRKKANRIPTDYGSETEERRRVDVWHVDDFGVGRRAWIGGPAGLGGAGMGF
ncbi:hypothetical protein BDY24DRAFT_10294 [Mrakia frigida]|uniref:uncharacterized protein n=1 Tax=Mrakia frigida TaxID=29902 RepID=UPI003FCBFC9B